MTSPNKVAIRQALIIIGLMGLQYFSWASHSVTLFNGLASPLFFTLATYLIVLASQYTISVSPRSLVLFLLFTTWVVFTDARSGEFLPALAMDSHWFVLPLSVLLISEVFREYPLAFQAIRVGAAICIINLLITMYLEAEWYFDWHYPPIFGHIRHLGLSVGFMTILLFTKNEMPGWVAVFFRLTRILGLALVFWSGTRASMLAWILCIAVFIYTDRRWARILVVDTLTAMAIALIPDPAMPGNGFFGTFRRSLGAVSANDLSSSRLAIWQSTVVGLNEIDRLWTGVGGNGFARLQVMHEVVISARGHVQAHNIIVQSTCDWGLIGLTLLTGFFCQSTLRPIVADRKNNDPTALSGIVYLLTTGMLDATLFHLEHLNYLAIVVAYLSSQRQPNNSRKIIIPSPAILVFLLGLAFLHTQTFTYRIGLWWYFPSR